MAPLKNRSRHRRRNPFRKSGLVTLGISLLVCFAGCTSAAGYESDGCIESGDQNDFNALLSENGPGYVLQLCVSTVYELTGPIIFTAKDQEISTMGYPENDFLKAKLLLVGGDSSTMIQGDCRRCARVSVRNLIIDGNRSDLGRMPTQDPSIVSSALILFGNNEGQSVTNSVIRDPRGWAAIQLREGDLLACHGALIEGNTIGPVGEEWVEERDGEDPERSPVGKPLADGLSLACKDSIVRGNTFFDNTDAAIVVYCATGSWITSNTIQTIHHSSMGGILMVDAVPFDGDYTNTRVQNNTLEAAENTLMRVGIGIGARVWSDDTDTVLRGGIVTENILQGGGMGYGIAVGGVEDFTITENESRVVSKKHSGVRGQRCLVPLEADEEAAFGMSREEREVGIVKNPEPMAFLRNGESISGGEVQEDFVEGDFTYLVCIDPEYMDDGSLRPQTAFSSLQPPTDASSDSGSGTVKDPFATETEPESSLKSVLEEVLAHSEGRLLDAITSIESQVDYFMEGTQIQKQLAGGKALGRTRLAGEDNADQLLLSLTSLSGRVAALEAERSILRNAMEDLQKEFRNFGSLLTRAQNQDSAVLSDLRQLLRQHQANLAAKDGDYSDPSIEVLERMMGTQDADATPDWTQPILYLLCVQAFVGLGGLCLRRWARRRKPWKRS